MPTRCWHSPATLDIFGESDEAEPCYRESLELFVACSEEDHVANVRFRVAANMFMRGEADAAWPLLEEALTDFRERGMPLGEGQALAFLGEKALQEGDLERSRRAVPRERSNRPRSRLDVVGAEPARKCCLRPSATAGDLDAAEELCLALTRLALALGDRQHIVFAGAMLAAIAAARGDSDRAGLIWGAVETEAAAGRVGQWERDQPEFEELVLAVDGPAFARPAQKARLLSIAQAAGRRAGGRAASPFRAPSAPPSPSGRWSGSRRGSSP